MWSSDKHVNDKYKHCVTSWGEIAKQCGAGNALAAGEIHEWISEIFERTGWGGNGGYSDEDMVANHAGADCSSGCLSAGDCGSCCEGKGYDATDEIGE